MKFLVKKFKYPDLENFKIETFTCNFYDISARGKVATPLKLWKYGATDYLHIGKYTAQKN